MGVTVIFSMLLTLSSELAANFSHLVGEACAVVSLGVVDELLFSAGAFNVWTNADDKIITNQATSVAIIKAPMCFLTKPSSRYHHLIIKFLLYKSLKPKQICVVCRLLKWRTEC